MKIIFISSIPYIYKKYSWFEKNSTKYRPCWRIYDIRKENLILKTTEVKCISLKRLRDKLKEIDIDTSKSEIQKIFLLYEAKIQ